ncbi:DUF222 domain-containing protein [Agromyces sp. NPDC060279]|uniref:HNH endonuclease n=1 Tax=Agromyces sp. NPDC060279 TaxID=3347092 RepID=UPI0036674E6D
MRARRSSPSTRRTATASTSPPAAGGSEQSSSTPRPPASSLHRPHRPGPRPLHLDAAWTHVRRVPALRRTRRRRARGGPGLAPGRSLRPRAPRGPSRAERAPSRGRAAPSPRRCRGGTPLANRVRRAGARPPRRPRDDDGPRAARHRGDPARGGVADRSRAHRRRGGPERQRCGRSGHPAPRGALACGIGQAIARGELTVTVADALRSGIGPIDELDDRSPADGEPGAEPLSVRIARALPELIAVCRSRTPEQARRAARSLRERLDPAGVERRAEAQRRAQFWRMWQTESGMFRGEFELEPVAGAEVKALFDRLSHPRRLDRSVRRSFGHPVHGERAYAEARMHRERNAAEGLAQLLRAGASVNPRRVLGERRPAVHLIVNAASLERGRGSGALEGHSDRVPLATIAAGLCEGYLPVRFDGGAVLDLGRDERLFSDAQKAAMAVRDGGCRDPECDRPPSWTEAHHIAHWGRDDGRTDLADGILLCRRDHLRYHNEGWEVRREGSDYWLIPPPRVDPRQRPRAMPSKTPADVLDPFAPD